MSEIRDGMRIDWDVPIKMDDGLVLRADVYRPTADGCYPVILSYGPYAKGLAFQQGYPSAWQRMVSEHPDVAYGSTNKYQNWEVVNPEKWVPDGYICVRVDSRGTGRSPGTIDHFSPRETRDFYHCIEWSGVQPWSSGKVGQTIARLKQEGLSIILVEQNIKLAFDLADEVIIQNTGRVVFTGSVEALRNDEATRTQHLGIF